MSHNTFGHLFRVTTWGESHGPALGCVVDGCPPGIELTAEMIGTVREIVGAGNTQELDPTMGGEDFSFFANEVPGFYYRLGVHREGTRTGPHHSPFFRADSASVAIGMRVMSNLLVDYLLRNAG